MISVCYLVVFDLCLIVLWVAGCCWCGYCVNSVGLVASLWFGLIVAFISISCLFGWLFTWGFGCCFRCSIL